MRIFSGAIVLLALTACGGAETEREPVDPLLEAEADARARLADSGMIFCAVDGEGGFRRECTIERTQGQDGLILTLRHADGGFRRLLVTDDGRGVIAADGAEQAEVSPISAAEIEVAIAGDRYRLPATVRQ